MGMINATAAAPEPYPGVYVGHQADAHGRRLRYKAANLHLLTIGVPGSAKSAGLIISNVAHLRQSMIIIDGKGGQLTAITRRKRERMGRVIVVNLLDYKTKELPQLKGEKWSCLHQLDSRSPDFMNDCDCIADAIVTKGGSDSGNAKFFEIGAENLVSLGVAHERATKGDKADLRNVRTMLSEPSILHKRTKQPVGGLALTLQQMTNSDLYAIRTTASRILARLTDANSLGTSLQDVIDTALKDFRFLNNDVVAFNMSRGAIEFAALHREIVTIFFVLPIEDLAPEGMGKTLRLFINLALRNLYRNPPILGATLPRVLFILEEFAAVGRLSEVPKALGAARDYSLCLWFILQNMSQLKTSYPKEWPLFFTGSGAKSFFRAGDYETAEYCSKLCGSEERYVMTQNQNGGSSLTPHAIPLIRPEDLMRLPPRVTVNLIDPCPFPIMARVPLYTETPWNEGLDPNPFYRG